MNDKLFLPERGRGREKEKDKVGGMTERERRKEKEVEEREMERVGGETVGGGESREEKGDVEKRRDGKGSH